MNDLDNPPRWRPDQTGVYEVWYTARDGQRQGPFDETKVRELAQSGELQPRDLVWHTGETCGRRG